MRAWYTAIMPNLTDTTNFIMSCYISAVAYILRFPFAGRRNAGINNLNTNLPLPLYFNIDLKFAPLYRRISRNVECTSSLKNDRLTSISVNTTK